MAEAPMNASKTTPFSAVSASEQHTCGLTKAAETIACWGYDKYKQASGMTGTKRSSRSYCAGLPNTTKFSAVSAGGSHTCGLTKADETIACWGCDRDKEASGMNAPKGKCGLQDTGYCAGLPAATKFSAVSAGGGNVGNIMRGHTCGLTKENETIACWGYDKSKQASGMNATKGKCGTMNLIGKYSSYCAGLPAATKFSAVSAGEQHTCGVTKADETIACWGYDREKQSSGMTGTKDMDRECGSSGSYCAGLPATTKFSAVSAGGSHTCGLTKADETIACWGNDEHKQASGMTAPKGKCGHQDTGYCAGLPAATKFSAVSAGGYHTCGVTKEDVRVVCWGENNYNQAKVPEKDIKWVKEPSCLTAHPKKSGPASCTACNTTCGNAPGCNRHFTIVDPKTNTGTCTKKECPFCKPKECCGANHKHYVINTMNLEGVCVRHNDDCTSVCMPRGQHPASAWLPGHAPRRVCSKASPTLNPTTTLIASQCRGVIRCSRCPRWWSTRPLRQQNALMPTYMT